MTMTPDQFDAFLELSAVGIQNASLHDAMQDCLDVIHGGVEDAFAAKVDSAGAAWPPRKDKLTHPLLVKSGKLKAAATTGGTVGDRELTTSIKGADVPYAATHQNGSTKRNIPRREYQYATEETLDACAEIIADAGLEAIFPH